MNPDPLHGVPFTLAGGNPAYTFDEAHHEAAVHHAVDRAERERARLEAERAEIAASTPDPVVERQRFAFAAGNCRNCCIRPIDRMGMSRPSARTVTCHVCREAVKRWRANKRRRTSTTTTFEEAAE